MDIINTQIINKLDDTLDLLLDIFDEAKILAEQSNNRDFIKIVNKLDIVKDRLVQYNLVELNSKVP